jgi:hypothetical protein
MQRRDRLSFFRANFHFLLIPSYVVQYAIHAAFWLAVLPNVNGMEARSVADPGCLSRILIFVHPASRIQDPIFLPLL